MKLLTERGNVDEFFSRLAKAPGRVLLLDYDGTLAPFQVERDKAVPYEGLPDILDAIVAEGSTRLVIVSGRWTEDLLPLLGMKEQPEVWGCHGWERLWSDGRHEQGELPGPVDQALEQADQWAKEQGLEEQVERKPASVALHWRGRSDEDRERIHSGGQEAWGDIAENSELELHEFDGGLELRYPGRDKGYAVRQLLSEESARTVFAYLGDDRTDEDAFSALQERGLNVLVRSEYRQTAADLWIEPPEELLWFLRRWLDICKKGEK